MQAGFFEICVKSTKMKPMTGLLENGSSTE